MLTISGVRHCTTSGGGTEGAATQNLRSQIPLIAQEFPEVQGCHFGTINLKFDCSLIIARFDFRTGLINWHPAHSPGEVFDFLRIQLEAPEGSNRIDAWVYVAHHSDHRRDPTMHEVIASEYCNLNRTACCRIHIDRDYIELPYRMNPTRVVV